MELINNYKKDGFIFLENMYSDDEIENIKSIINNYKMNDYNNTLDENNKSLRIESIVYQNKDLKKIIEKDNIIKILNKCIDSEVVLFKDKVIYKNPGSENSLVPHIDGLFESFNYRLNKKTFGWYTYSSKFINLSIMLSDNTIENGCLFINKLKSNDNYYLFKEFVIEGQNNKINMNKVHDNFYPITGKKGSVIIFNPSCIHYSKNNISNEIRMNLYMTYSDKKDGDNYLLNLEDKKLITSNIGIDKINNLSSGNDYFNVLIIGFGNIALRYYEALLKLNYYSINLYILSNNDPKLSDIKYVYFQDVSEIKNNNFDIVIISTCSNVRLNIIKSIINNNNIKYIKNLILEKVVFSNIYEYIEFNNMDKSKINNIYINSFWKNYLDVDEIKLFNKPKIQINCSNKFGICCNLIHILIWLNKLINLEDINYKDYKIIDSKRKNYNELIFNMESKYLDIVQKKDEKRYLKIIISEKKFKLVYELIENNNYLINFYENEILINNYTKNIGNVSSHLMNEFNKLLIENYNNINLCCEKLSYNNHEKLFKIFENINDLKIT